jgi:drug/metabolite transporter (DMT)-like permease
MHIYLGEIAALATSACWSATASFFAIASRRIGSNNVNRLRLLTALILLLATHWILTGRPLPWGAAPQAWLWLSLSGLVGFVIGDAFLFASYVAVGPRLGMLMMSLAPVISTILAAWVFAEHLSPVQLLGIAITIAGVGWVVLDGRGSNQVAESRRHYLRGILFGLGAATGQAAGLILSKEGLSSGITALSGNVIRVSAACLAIWLIAALQRQVRGTVRAALADPHTLPPIALGSIFGPFIGVWLSLVAIQNTEIGVASTLMALPPVFMVPIGRYVFHETIGWQSIAGTLVAIAGVALLFLV